MVGASSCELKKSRPSSGSTSRDATLLVDSGSPAMAEVAARFGLPATSRDAPWLLPPPYAAESAAPIASSQLSRPSSVSARSHSSRFPLATTCRQVSGSRSSAAAGRAAVCSESGMAPSGASVRERNSSSLTNQ